MVETLAKKLAELVEIFRHGKWASDFNWWDQPIFDPCFGYQDGEPLFEKVVQGIIKLNSEMLSQRYVENELTFEFLQAQTTNYTEAQHAHDQSLINEAKSFINKLIGFEAWQDVDFLIANLQHEGEAVKLGRVTFIVATKEELERWRKHVKTFWPKEASNVQVIAHVRAPGDQSKAISYARAQVDLAIDILRAFCFPFGRHSDTWRFGVVGDIAGWAYTPIRINNREFPTQVSGRVAFFELRKHILSKLEQPQWELINKLILKTGHTEMETKLLDGIHWLAESTKPDKNNSKFAKISFALETLIGGEPENEELKVRGITAMLAERAAFIAGRDLPDKLAIDEEIRTYYRKRGKIVHGGKEEISLGDIDKFGELIRRLALALLEKLNVTGKEISSIEKLSDWVRTLRYTLPNNNKEELNAAG